MRRIYPLLATGLVVLLYRSAQAESALDVGLLSADALAAQLRERKAELESERNEKSALEQELSSLPELEHNLSNALARDVRALYRLRRGGLLPMADGLDSLLGHASRVAHFERMTRRTLAKLTDARNSSARISGEVAALEVKIGATEQTVIELEHAQGAIDREAAATRAFEAATRMEERAPVPAVDPLALTNGTGSLSLAAVGLVAEEPRARGRGRFASQRGELALPVSGSASIASADTLSGEPNALTFSGKSGSSVRAVADGRVVLAEPREGHGVLVIVEHGDRYRSLYGGLESADVEVGDSVSKSARIGTAGSAPVYFELRHATRSQDARAWLGL